MRRDLTLGEPVDPVLDRRKVAGPVLAEEVGPHELSGLSDVAGRLEMADRLARVSMLLVPGARPAMQVEPERRVLATQVGQEHVRQQAVIAIPLLSPVERDQEEVRAFKVAEGGAGPLAAEHRVAERPRQPAQQRGVRHEPRQVRRQLSQHLVP